MASLGMADQPGPSTVTSRSPLADVYGFVAEAERGFAAAVEVLTAGLPERDGVARSTETVVGVDGNPIQLFIHRPAGSDATSRERPAVIHFHGGAMVMFAAAGIGYQRWRDALATAGVIAIGVEFRNGAGVLGPHPFPAGLDDCLAAVSWVDAHRAQLGVSLIVVSGESGGGNLALASALAVAAAGRSGQIDGVFAQCPYISNAYDDPDPALPSLIENDGYTLSCEQLAVLARGYDPDRLHADDPLAWPLRAGLDQLRGLPPHVISANQLDPLRDEALLYHRRLIEAGVSSVSRTVNGTCHAGDCLFEAAMPDIYWSSIRDIAGFANSL